MNDSLSESGPELEAQQILLAASHHNLEALSTLLRTGSANVQDLDTGYTPLHTAIASCAASEPLSSAATSKIDRSESVHENAPKTTAERIRNGCMASGEERGFGEVPDHAAAEKTVKLLLQNGAIWNDLDKDNETPGCLALRLGLNHLYDIMVDAGVRAELLLSRLDGYELLTDEDDEEEQEQEAGLEPNTVPTEPGLSMASIGRDQIVGTEHSKEARKLPDQASLVDVNSEDYLRSSLTFTTESLLDGNKNGVMMAWETGIMERTAELLVPDRGLRVLNVGHGMGIIDDFLQKRSPSTHHIIEAHPAVLEQMKKQNWTEKFGVTVHGGRWQDVVPRLIEEGIVFDAIYFDTFAEDYKELHGFFEENVTGLLDEGGKWSFFHGLGADRQICYDVYTKVVEIDLLEAGYDVEWETLPVPDLDLTGQWEGIKRSYWQLPSYRLPVCTFIG
ncbi:Arginine N-methyltransferase 2 [Xylographa carneopallida]|nr:Arginine N-methyltransferase 2 [Xylographa carneopallida]